MRSRAAALVINVFAPRNPAELHRILAPDGRLVVLTPTTNHLGSLVEALDLLTVDELKDERLEEKLGDRFRLDRRSPIEYSMHLGQDDVHALVDMGPSAWHTDSDAIRRRITEFSEPFVTEASVAISVYELR